MDLVAEDRDHALDPETIELGRQQIARLRARRSVLADPHGRRPPPAPTVASPPSDSETSDERFTPERIEAEMATAAERDALVARIQTLESEVAHLRAALSAVLDAAATGIRPPTPADSPPTTGPTPSTDATP